MDAKLLKVGFLGAGGVNFGGPEGPWDHATRLEKYCSNNVVVTAIVDPAVHVAEAVLKARRSNPKYGYIYSFTKIYTSLGELLKEDKEILPDAMFIGLPPAFHGSTKYPHDVEMQLAQAGIHMFIEKPLSCHSQEEVLKVNEVISKAKSKDGRKLVVSVGYMLRYSYAVKKMHEILKQYNSRVISTVARYNCAYTSILKPSWWDVRFSGGPIVEQATHFCDLSRHFGGDVDLGSVKAVCVSANDEIGTLEKIPVNEGPISPENKIPRATSAIWKYKNGAVGTLNHGLLMHGQRYSTEFEVWGDGIRLVLLDPYLHCKLLVRTPESDFEREVPLEEEDMYLGEMKAFIDAIESNDTSPILSSYDDAYHTYALSWAIRQASQ